jgi:hypothetical protein
MKNTYPLWKRTQNKSGSLTGQLVKYISFLKGGIGCEEGYSWGKGGGRVWLGEREGMNPPHPNTGILFLIPNLSGVVMGFR